MSQVTYHLAPVTFHLSLTQTATAPDPILANSPAKLNERCTMHYAAKIKK